MNNDHLDINLLTEYWASSLPTDELIAVAEHLAECDTCVELSQRVHRLATLWDDWSDRVVGEESFPDRIARTIRAWIRSADPTKYFDLEHSLLGAFSFNPDQSGSRAHLHPQALRTLLPPQALFDTLLPVGVYARGGKGATRQVLKIGSTHSDANVKFEILSGGTLRLELQNWPADSAPPVALLIESTEGGNTETRLLEFEGITPSGEFTLHSPSREHTLVFLGTRKP